MCGYILYKCTQQFSRARGCFLVSSRVSDFVCVTLCRRTDDSRVVVGVCLQSERSGAAHVISEDSMEFLLF